MRNPHKTYDNLKEFAKSTNINMFKLTIVCDEVAPVRMIFYDAKSDKLI